MRQAQPWYMLISVALVIGLLGTAWLSWVWWGPKPYQAPRPQVIIIDCLGFDGLIKSKQMPELVPLPYERRQRAGNGAEQFDEIFLPPKPVKVPPKYGPGIGGGHGKGLDGWIFPELPGEEEVVPEMVVDLRPELIPDVTGFVFADEKARPINLAEIQALVPEILRSQVKDRPQFIWVRINKKGEYLGHRWHDETPHIIRQAIEPLLPKLRFTPEIR
ncbi:MAG: hypothetical protein AAGM67_19470, partial [Bacteroidota bacterium]